jgi:TRIAD3 protein (E3 ubiquitin-protein ligase RNF216)
MKIARRRGELVECGCCLEAELLPEDCVDCPGGHRFCRVCVQLFAETAVGYGRLGVVCLEERCQQEFTMEDLERTLTPTIYRVLEQRLQVTIEVEA